MSKENQITPTVPERRDRFTAIELRGKSAENAGTLYGYAAVFDKWSDPLHWFKEIIRPGAFKNSLETGADVRAFINHDTGRIIGRNTAGTLRLEEDAIGLKVEIDLPNTQDGRDLAVSVERGDLTGMSFGFNVVKDRWTHDEDADLEERELLEIELLEVSPVAIPAYPDTALAKRSFDKSTSEKPFSTTPVHVARAQSVYLNLKSKL